MPVFELKTNIAEEKIPKNLAINLVSVVADALHKPAEYVVVEIKGSCNLSFGGTNEPAGLGKLASIGGINRESNKVLSKKIMAYLEKELGLSSARIYIQFIDLSKECVGFKGTTFDDFL
ncbi:hypothetical protein RDWZM_000913 [Blomia tropicalis]|uniref:L-dopachrome isomerase n=1 Tax=Blomia tropicalis TaxID=40697 RepID=A0A9Q0RNF9_BLOTA|nr:hypothetical protein BLOT_015226 [Blomia tropicalis]KAJ6222368.1 hypothetical protein RDWZM_000913 [Blomia tropicalis]